MEDAVEPGEEASQQTLGLCLGLEQQGAERGAEGERVEGGEENRDRDGDGELLVEATGDAGNEGRGNEDRGEDERDGDDRAGHLLHGSVGRVNRGHALFDVVLDGFDDDDGVIDDQADGEHQAEERKRVDGEPEQREDHEGADERDRHGEQGDERGAPSLQEDVDDQDDEGQRDEERDEDLVNAGVDGRGGVERDVIRHVRREGLGELVHPRANIFCRLNGVGAGELIDSHDGRRLAFKAAIEVVGLCAELDAGDVPEVEDRAVGVGAQDDVAELLRGDEASLGADGVGELLTSGDRLAADLAGWVYGVLRLQGSADLRDGDAELGELVGLDPDAQGVLAGAEDLDAGDALDAGDFVDQVDVRVVGEEGAVVGGVRRRDGQQHQRRGEGLVHGEAGDGDLGGQLALRLVDAQLRENLVGVGVGRHIEVDGQLGKAVAGVGRLHVVHVVDAVHLLLDRRGDGLFERLGVGTGVGGLDKNLGRHDVGELRRGQAQHARPVRQSP